MSPTTSQSPALTPYDELRATEPMRQDSLVAVQTAALREIDALQNRLLILGVQFPFLQEQIEGGLSLFQSSRETLLQTLGPQIQAEAQANGKGTLGGISSGAPAPSMESVAQMSPPPGVPQ